MEIGLNGMYDVISSDPPLNDHKARFTTVYLKILLKPIFVIYQCDIYNVYCATQF